MEWLKWMNGKWSGIYEWMDGIVLEMPLKKCKFALKKNREKKLGGFIFDQEERFKVVPNLKKKTSEKN